MGRTYQWHRGGYRQRSLLALCGHREAHPYYPMAEKWICGMYIQVLHSPCISVQATFPGGPGINIAGVPIE